MKKMVRSKWKLLLLAAALVAAGIISIFLFTQDTDAPIYVVYIPKTEISSNDFWTSVLAGAEMAAKENNVNLEITSPTDELHVDEQNELILEAIEKHPDVIAVSPSSRSENIKALSAVKEAGIKLIFIDSKTDEEIQDVCISTDNVAAGRKMAEPMLPTLNKESKIAIVSHVRNSSTAEERERGFREGLGDYASQVVEVVFSNSMKEVGAEVTKELLIREPDITYLACLNEDSAVGAARAVKELGMERQICIVGFDNSTEEIIRLEEGVFSAIVVQKAFSMGYLGIENAAKLARGEEVEAYIDSGSVLITKENMYMEENQELLFPFY
ncbi:MAG: substrate-binding domain-containing protein [Lachnospiraceae bacterium]